MKLGDEFLDFSRRTLFLVETVGRECDNFERGISELIFPVNEVVIAGFGVPTITCNVGDENNLAFEFGKIKLVPFEVLQAFELVNVAKTRVVLRWL